MAPADTHSPHSPHARRNSPPLTFADLTADLIWPSLLRAGQLALRPSRIGMALVFVIGLMLLWGLSDRLDSNPNVNELEAAFRVMRLDAAVAGVIPDEPGRRFGDQLFNAMVAEPGVFLMKNPWAALIALPLIALWTALAGGAICRSAACDVGQAVGIDWPQAVGFALSRWRSLLLSLIGPLLIVWGICFAMAVAGWVLFSLPVLNLLGGLAWGLFLLGGGVCAIVMMAFVVGWPLMVPSVACEGTDAVDALQHAYSFVFARPLRLAVYLAILLMQFALLGGVVMVVCWLSVHIAQACGLQWSGWRGEHVLGTLPLHAALTAQQDLAGTQRPAHWLVTFWTLLPAVGLPLAFVVSYIWSSSTVLYLAMRRLVDGQDMHEIWMPGMVEGTQARAATPSAAAPSPVAGAAHAPRTEAVSDNDLADET